MCREEATQLKEGEEDKIRKKQNIRKRDFGVNLGERPMLGKRSCKAFDRLSPW